MAVGGYDPTFQTVWLHIEEYQEDGTTKFVSYRFGLGRKNFSPRVLHIGDLGSGKTPVKGFNRRSDGTMTIIYADGLLKYPNLSGTYRFEDDVTSAGGSVGRGGEFSLKMVLGSLSSMTKKFNLKAVLADVVGESINRMGRYGLRFFGNRQADAFDTKEVPIDEKPVLRGIDQTRGDLEIGEVELYLPEDKLSNFREVEVSSMEIGYEVKNREGNR